MPWIPMTPEDKVVNVPTTKPIYKLQIEKYSIIKSSIGGIITNITWSEGWENVGVYTPSIYHDEIINSVESFFAVPVSQATTDIEIDNILWDILEDKVTIPAGSWSAT